MPTKDVNQVYCVIKHRRTINLTSLKLNFGFAASDAEVKGKVKKNLQH